MDRNRIGLIIAAAVAVLILIWIFAGLGGDDEAVVTTEDGETVEVETD